MNIKTIKVSEVVFRSDLYPRIKTDPITVEKYAEDLTVLPPIELNQRYELIDGWHRWTAHRQVNAENIVAIVTDTASDSEFLELAIERNATHGLQLSQSDKEDMAKKIYNSTPTKDRDGKKKQLSKILSVSEKTVYRWLGRIDKDAKVERDRRIFELWLACHTQEEIAEAVGCSRQTVDIVLPKMDKCLELAKPAHLHQDEAFEPPIYNVWRQKSKSDDVKHFGNTEPRWLDNLLYLYTKPFDVVIDPFAGGGSTIEACKKRMRRYLVSDRKPKPSREKEIRCHDITAGLLKPPQWKDVSLVYLDPPYWKQAEGEYSSDPSDLANMPIEQFNEVLSGLIAAYGEKLETGSRIALVIQPTQWNAPERRFTDHIGDMLRFVKLPVEMRFSVPYESQQCNAQMVEWAKKEKQCLVLTREIIVWRKQ